MSDIYERTKLIVAESGINKLKNSCVMIFGVGGVGGMAVEMLARAGVGKLILVDFDKFDVTNLNRQILSHREVIGRAKVDVAKERIHAINPDADVIVHNTYFTPDDWDKIFTETPDFVIDAIDSVKSKVFLVHQCIRRKIKVISSMGAGNKLDASKVRIADISQTSNCGLARVVRKSLKNLGIHKGLKVVFSPENAIFDPTSRVEGEKLTTGSISYMPNLFGTLAAGFVLEKLLKS